MTLEFCQKFWFQSSTLNTLDVKSVIYILVDKIKELGVRIQTVGSLNAANGLSTQYRRKIVNIVESSDISKSTL